MGRLSPGFPIEIISDDQLADIAGARWHVAIGDNEIRRRLFQTLCDASGQAATIVHPSSIVDASGVVGDGCFIAAGAVVAPNARIGDGAIINHSAVIDHDCRVGSWAHIAPGVVMGGASRVADGCLIGAGAIILPGLQVGEGAVVGAGAVVTKSLLARQTVTGVPARSTA